MAHLAVHCTLSELAVAIAGMGGASIAVIIEFSLRRRESRLRRAGELRTRGADRVQAAPGPRRRR